jgi:hypothetical protein
VKEVTVQLDFGDTVVVGTVARLGILRLTTTIGIGTASVSVALSRRQEEELIRALLDRCGRGSGPGAASLGAAASLADTPVTPED